MPSNTDALPFEPSTGPDTRASTDGELPFPVAVFLTILSLPIVLTFGSQLGFPPTHLAVLFGTGALAAGSIHLATTNTGPGYTVTGIFFLWVTATIFAITTIDLITTPNPVVDNPLVTFLIAGAALLTPFGLIGSSIKTFGHGAAQTLLSRYLLGTLALAVIIVLLVIQGTLRSIAVTGLGILYTSVTGMALGDGSLYLRGFTTVFLYMITSMLVHRAVHKAPIDVFIPAANAGKVTAIREKVDTAHHYALVTIGLYFVTVATTTVMVQVSESPLVTTLTLITQTGSSTPVITVSVILLTGALATILLVSTVQRVSNITVSELIEILTPAVTITVIILFFTTLTGDTVSSHLLQTPVGEEISPNGVLHQLVTGQPSVVVLGLFATTLLLSGIVLSIPSFIAGIKVGDESFTGLTATIISLSVIVVISITAQSHAVLIVAGVVLIAIIWEIGEHTTVAVGETKLKTRDESLPSGFYALVAVHIAAITGLAIIAQLAGTATLLVFTTPHIPPSIAAIALVFCTIAFAVFIKLLPG